MVFLSQTSLSNQVQHSKHINIWRERGETGKREGVKSKTRGRGDRGWRREGGRERVREERKDRGETDGEEREKRREGWIKMRTEVTRKEDI